ncbi:MAG: M48 family metallopeptidase [Acidobacteria bacterium]|nr:M48 family metallopeptidase [Acidobacteriota bacterium]
MTQSGYFLTVAGIPVLLERKPVKHLRIKVRPPEGRIQLSVPLQMSDDAVRKAVLSKINWIRKQRLHFSAQLRTLPLEYKDGEKIPFKGREYELTLIEQQGRSCVEVTEPRLIRLCVRPGSSRDARRKVMDDWYRRELKKTAAPLMGKWQQIMGVQAGEWRIKRMKTRWGSCNTRARRIWINLELIKLPVYLLEVIVVHELTHLLEPSHNKRFKTLMSRFLPDWQKRQKALKSHSPRPAKLP